VRGVFTDPFWNIVGSFSNTLATSDGIGRSSCIAPMLPSPLLTMVEVKRR
jgi:hypothetical protein